MLLLDQPTQSLNVIAFPSALSQPLWTTQKSDYKLSDYPQEKVKSFAICASGQTERVASAYFTMNCRTYHSLLGQAGRDRWSVNWAEHFQHFFLKVVSTDQIFGFSNLQEKGNQLHFYWDGQDWFYFYIWDAQTQNFVEGISRETKALLLRNGQGAQVYDAILTDVQH